MFDIVLLVVGLILFVVAGEYIRSKMPVQKPLEEEPTQTAAPDLNRRELNEDFIERVLWIAGHAKLGADVYQEGGSIVVKYDDGTGYKISLFSSSKLRQPKRRYARDVVKSNGHHKPAPKQEPVYEYEEPAEFAAAWR